jgi:hypothetical protein
MPYSKLTPWEKAADCEGTAAYQQLGAGVLVLLDIILIGITKERISVRPFHLSLELSEAQPC